MAQPGVIGIPLTNLVTFSAVAGSPFTLSSSWTKVTATTTATRALIVTPTTDSIAGGVFDVQWTMVPANTTPPSDTYGIPVLAGENFSETGIPYGDVYLKSASGQVVVVYTGA